jgi:hypothetical protein
MQHAVPRLPGRVGPWVVAVLVAVLAAPAAADEAPLVTDRPTAGISSTTVGQWRVVLEFGADVDSAKTGDIRTLSWRTPAKLRFGVLDRLELHLETPGFAADAMHGGPLDDTASYGFGGLGFGFKAHLVEGGYWKGGGPSLGLMTTLVAPLGTAGFDDDAWVPRVVLAAEWSLPQAFGLGFNVGAEAPRGDGGARFVQGKWSVALARSWAPLTDRVATFIEFFGDLAFSSPANNGLSVDGGFTFLLTPNVQVDIALRAGILGTDHEVGGGLGMAFRL